MIDVEHDFQRMQDYIVGRLSEDEDRLFEDRLTRDPELVREFEQSLRLRAGLEQLREQKQRAKAAPFRTSLLVALPLLAAAALAAIALMVRTEIRPAEPSALMAAIPSANASAALTPFAFVPLRGATTYVIARPSAGLIDFKAAPGAAASRWRMSLTRTGVATPLGRAGNLSADRDGFVHAYADPTLLPAGDYVLRIEPETDATGTVHEFPFRLRAEAPQR
jgi:hypothetical protein